ncbi:quinol:cytochrome C oxidoreductase [Sphingobacteriales bacterium UPWRP_1]|nr:hypothetical protein BVG80_06470 [Sphingobacteriales bacterium TSM_CSM]PSJ78053.1 quinol:cytochrome C oxidoreductase [Sphingobacteriales bacterium UPWRP_1]
MSTANDKFTIPGKARNFSFILLIAGIVLAAIGAVMNLDNPTRLWTGLLYNNIFFLMLGLVAALFLSAHIVGYGGWVTLFRRVPEAMMLYVPVGGILMLLILFFGLPHIYHWSDPELYNPNSPHYDAILDGKRAFLNPGFFFIRAFSYILIWSGLIWLLRRNSIQSDLNPLQGVKLYQSSKYIAAIFIVVYAVTSSTSSWDWIMSIQPHWYSTLFGWYNFISMFVTCNAVMMLILIFLTRNGYLPGITNEHFHDLGKFMFGFSVAWAYLFYSQFMLIWYANIPEETLYFKYRIDNYPMLMWLCVVLNFVTPFFLLITRNAKRDNSRRIMIAAAVIIIFGHWLDFYQMTMPGAFANMAHGAAEEAHGHHEIVRIGLYEIGLLLAYAGLFTYMFLFNLSRQSLISVNHPFLKESRVYHT